MFKVLYATKDAYIQNRVINGQTQVSGNVGLAGSLDLFKLYGYTSTSTPTGSVPNVELSRLLVQFDLQPLRDMLAAKRIDTNSPTFSCRLHLYDVYGGQPTPDNFGVIVYPLSASFDEGHGRDVVYYSDFDICNWFSSSFATGSWVSQGCANGATYPQACDFFTASGSTAFGSQQTFFKGTEDLDVDVTAIVSSTLAGLLPDAGFRVAFIQTIENDQRSYFVKRFGSRQAYNIDKQPKLFVRFDDSIQDDTQNTYLDTTSYLFLYNYIRGALTNLTSGSTPVTGSNCLVLKLQTPVSGGIYTLFVTGSQHFSGINPQTGIYSASVTIPMNDPLLMPQWQFSGSITFTPTWQSLDGTVTYVIAPPNNVLPPVRGPQSRLDANLDVTVLHVQDEYDANVQQVLKINIWDFTQPFLLNATRLPVELPGMIIRDVHYQIRNFDNGSIVIPVDLTYNSTRLSNDSTDMYFTLDTSNLTPGQTYVIDIMVVTNNAQRLIKGASKAFRVVDWK